jgi:predicted RNA-binding protein
LIQKRNCLSVDFRQEGIDDILIVDARGMGQKWKNLVGLRYADCLPKDVFFKARRRNLIMCEANAYLIINGKEQLIMESVDLVEPKGENEWTLVSMFGEQKTVTGRIKAMELVDHRVLFETPIR